MTDIDGFIPELRTDFLRCEIDGETVVWSPLTAEPTVLDPVAALMLEVMDGQATVEQLAREVHDEVGVALDIARNQIRRTTEVFGGAGLLTASSSDTTAAQAVTDRELFINPCIPCMETAVRGMTSLGLQFGDQSVGVACDSRRGVRKLRSALADHVVAEGTDVPVGFVLTAPAGLQRTHHLGDRSGFVHSRGRGLDTGLHALAGHLTAFLPPEPGTVRVRAGAVVREGHIIVCLFPHLLVPEISGRELKGAGFGLVDRLALDIEVESGRIVNPPIPWPDLTALGPGPGHVGPAGDGRVTAIVGAAPVGSPPITRASAAITLASGAIYGAPQDVLDAATRLVDGAEILSTPPEADQLAEQLAAIGDSVP